MAGEKGRHIHCQHMARDNARRISGLKAAAHHGQGRRGDHQIYQRVRHHPADHRHRDLRHADQLAQRTAACGAAWRQARAGAECQGMQTAPAPAGSAR